MVVVDVDVDRGVVQYAQERNTKESKERGPTLYQKKRERIRYLNAHMKELSSINSRIRQEVSLIE